MNRTASANRAPATRNTGIEFVVHVDTSRRPQAHGGRFEETPKCACGLYQHQLSVRVLVLRPQAAGVNDQRAVMNFALPAALTIKRICARTDRMRLDRVDESAVHRAIVAVRLQSASPAHLRAP